MNLSRSIYQNRVQDPKREDILLREDSKFREGENII